MLVGVRAAALSLAMATAMAAAACGGSAVPAPSGASTSGPTTLTATAPTGATAPTTMLVIARPTVGAGAEAAGAQAAAIAKLEAFIAAHPDDLTYVPDALLRLGSLQLDRADDALAHLGQAPAAREVAEAEAARTTATAAAITALARLVDGYPGYPRRDLALSLLGYARAQAGDAAGALAAYAAVAALRASPLADEAQFRIGELRFTAGELGLAAAAYAPLAARPGKFAALAAFKLGWTHYRRGAYVAAMAGFVTVLALDDDAPMAADLRLEAAQYVALCLTEPDWDGDGHDDPAPPGALTATVARVAKLLGDGADPVGRDIAERAAQALTDEARYPEASAVYRLLLAGPVDAATRARIEAALAQVRARAH